MLEEVLKVFTDTLALQARQFDLQKDEYHSEFIKLLHKIYQNYELIIKDKIAIPKNENKIRDILVDDYLSKFREGYKEFSPQEKKVDLSFLDDRPTSYEIKDTEEERTAAAIDYSKAFGIKFYLFHDFFQKK